ncbi:MAG: ferrous iron transport protein A [Desulfobulbaceae bacterium]|nr:ferrous iron transport protein A [Desulfobulbaceae bacterium]
MPKDHPIKSCRLLSDIAAQCHRRQRCSHGPAVAGTPLPEACCNGRMRVCAINGDRQTCAKMANLGVRPGSELELLCKGGGQQCMIKINGGTLSLDAPTAAHILVAPA